jgi:hypothetical protein
MFFLQQSPDEAVRQTCSCRVIKHNRVQNTKIVSTLDAHFMSAESLDYAEVRLKIAFINPDIP